MKSWLYPLLTFFFIFILRFPMIPYGLEVGDEGYHLANQNLSNESGLQFITVIPFWWLSDLLGGLWLKLMDSYGLWGARLGGVLGNCFVGMMAVKIISLIYKPNFILALIVAATSLYAQPGRILYYDNVPEILFIVFGFLFLKMTQEPSKRAHQIASGLCLAALILSKWPMAVCAFIPMAALYWKRELVGSYLRMYAFSVGALMLFFFFLFYENLLTRYFSVSPPSPNHTIFYQLNLWCHQLKNKIPLIILLFSIPIGIGSILKYRKFKNTLSFPVFSLILLLLISALSSFFFTPKWYFPFIYQESTYILIYLLFSTACAISIYILRRSLTISEFVLFLLAISFPISQMLGSAIGVSKVYMGMWLLTGFSLYLFQRVAKQLGQGKRPLYLLHSILIFGMISAAVKYSNYGVLNSSELTSPMLRGIYTTQGKAESFDSLIREIGKYAKKGDRVLAYDYFPLVYFASETLPFQNRGFWVVLPQDILAGKLSEFPQMEPPVLIVRSKTDKEHPEWGLKPLPLCAHTNLEYRSSNLFKISMIDQAIQNSWNTNLVWSNLDFDLYLTSPKVKE